MTDVKEKNREPSPRNCRHPPAGAPVVAQAPVDRRRKQRCLLVLTSPSKKANGTMSKGEKWFEDFFYKKVNYWLNLGMSLLVTDFFTHEGKGGFLHPPTVLASKCWKMAAKGWRIFAIETLGIAKAEKALGSTRAWRLKTLALNTGGWVLLGYPALYSRAT